MAVSPLALKLIGAGVVATPMVGVGIVYGDDISIATGLKKQDFGKVENELLKILKDEAKDIIFTVNNGSGKDLKASDLDFSDSKEINLTVGVSTKNTNKLKGVKVEDLKNLNKRFGSAQDWTWECKITIDKKEQTQKVLSDKDKLLKESGSPEGVFGILKKDLTSQENKKDEWRDLKVRFFNNCVSSNNFSSEKDKFTRRVSFKVVDGKTTSKANLTSTAQVEDKLYFQDTKEFNRWFETPLKLTKWDLHLIDLTNESDFKFTVAGDDQLSSFSAESAEGKKEVSFAVNASNLQGETATNWTWKCVIKFIKVSGSGTTLKQKDHLVKTDTGYFEKLKKPGEKEIKVKFIEDCATFRSTTPTSLGEGSTISSEKTFNLKDEGGSNSATLTFENMEEFKYWFE